MPCVHTRWSCCSHRDALFIKRARKSCSCGPLAYVDEQSRVLVRLLPKNVGSILFDFLFKTYSRSLCVGFLAASWWSVFFSSCDLAVGFVFFFPHFYLKKNSTFLFSILPKKMFYIVFFLRAKDSRGLRHFRFSSGRGWTLVCVWMCHLFIRMSCHGKKKENGKRNMYLLDRIFRSLKEKGEIFFCIFILFLAGPHDRVSALPWRTSSY